jgi:hypothetical protein
MVQTKAEKAAYQRAYYLKNKDKKKAKVNAKETINAFVEKKQQPAWLTQAQDKLGNKVKHKKQPKIALVGDEEEPAWLLKAGKIVGVF